MRTEHERKNNLIKHSIMVHNFLQINSSESPKTAQPAAAVLDKRVTQNKPAKVPGKIKKRKHSVALSYY